MAEPIWISYHVYTQLKQRLEEHNSGSGQYDRRPINFFFSQHECRFSGSVTSFCSGIEPDQVHFILICLDGAWLKFRYDMAGNRAEAYKAPPQLGEQDQ